MSIRTLAERDKDWQTISTEEWQKKWMTADGGYIIPDDCIEELLRIVEEKR